MLNKKKIPFNLVWEDTIKHTYVNMYIFFFPSLNLINLGKQVLFIIRIGLFNLHDTDLVANVKPADVFDQ